MDRHFVLNFYLVGLVEEEDGGEAHLVVGGRVVQIVP